MTGQKWKFYFVMSLTLGRAPLILIFLLVNLLVLKEFDGVWYLGSPKTHHLWFSFGFGAMVLSAITDLFDGYFARKFKVVTNLGGYADPLTDKIFYLTAFPVLVFVMALRPEEMVHCRLLVALTVIFLVRDQWISFLRTIGALHNVDGKANWSGKARTIISFPTICCIYWYLMAPEDWPLRLVKQDWFIYVLEVASLIINVVSIWVYSVYYWPYLRKEAQITEPDNDPGVGE